MLNYSGYSGCYWSSSSYGNSRGWYLYFGDSSAYQINTVRSNSHAVRCVKE
ncbi:MAG: hypothetical protein LBJ17_00010 [Dysgonamonadaceae bacterium]|nr:hypothetical protein [Dysgonamonadaceae bacterium]